MKLRGLCDICGPPECTGVPDDDETLVFREWPGVVFAVDAGDRSFTSTVVPEVSDTMKPGLDFLLASLRINLGLNCLSNPKLLRPDTSEPTSMLSSSSSSDVCRLRHGSFREPPRLLSLLVRLGLRMSSGRIGRTSCGSSSVVVGLSTVLVSPSSTWTAAGVAPPGCSSTVVTAVVTSAELESLLFSTAGAGGISKAYRMPERLDRTFWLPKGWPWEGQQERNKRLTISTVVSWP